MARLTHYVKQDFTVRTTSNKTDSEVTQYTISWATITGAGFINNDEVGVIVFCAHGVTNNSAYSAFQVKIGSTFAGASVLSGSLQNIECASSNSDTGHPYIFIDDITLATNDNFYFSNWYESALTYTGRVDEFTCIIFKVSDLTSYNYKYAVTTPFGDASNSATNGASVTLGAGDWLILGMTQWLDDSTSADLFMTLNVAGSEIQRASAQGEDTANTINLGCMAYAASVSGSTTAKVQYWSGTSSTHDCVKTKIMAIRLNRFKNRWGVHSTSTITHTATDTYQEACGNGAYIPTSTAPHLVICLPKHQYALATHRSYGRIQVGGNDWPSTGVGRTSVVVNGPTTAHQSPLLIGYGTLTSGTSYDFDFDVAEDNTVATTYSCIQQDAVIFSLDMTGTLKRYDGSSWVNEPMKVYKDSTWQTKPLKLWNGSAWVEINTLG